MAGGKHDPRDPDPPSKKPEAKKPAAEIPPPPPIQGYRQLDADSVALMNQVKQHGESANDLVMQVAAQTTPPVEGTPDAAPGQDLILEARSHFRLAYMLLCRAIAKPSTFA